MKRGDVVVVAATGDHGKPRLAVIVQTDAFPETHISVVVCQMTSEVTEASDFRVTIDPSEPNGLRTRSQIMADKPVTVRRARVARSIGRLDDGDIGRLNIALAFVMGLATDPRAGRPPRSELAGAAHSRCFDLARETDEIVVIPERSSAIPLATQFAVARALQPIGGSATRRQRDLVALVVDHSKGSPDHAAPVKHGHPRALVNGETRYDLVVVRLRDDEVDQISQVIGRSDKSDWIERNEDQGDRQQRSERKTFRIAERTLAIRAPTPAIAHASKSAGIPITT
jgi:mRNA interferase MazF